MGRTLKMKVSATNSALNLLSELQEKYGENLMFHQSGGCCDGSAPMCFQEGEFPLGDNDIKLGEIGGVPFYMNGDQYEKWKHTDLTIDAVKGIGGMFSLDNGTGKRFLTKSEMINFPNLLAEAVTKIVLFFFLNIYNPFIHNFI